MKQIRDRKQHPSAIFKARDLFTAVVLAVSLFVTYRAWVSESRSADQTLKTEFYFRARESSHRIEQRIEIYEQALRATVGLFNASEFVTRAEFRRFIDTFGMPRIYPGIEGIGFALVIAPADLKRHVESIRRQGFPNYSVWPAGRRSLYTSIVYIEPFSGSNLRAFGYDMYSEPTRRAAMEQARDTGMEAASAKVALVQEEGSEPQSGFLMYLPVYRNNAPHETLEQRRANLVGWIYAPFRMNNFIRGINEEQPADLDIAIYDGNTIDAAARIYASARKDASATQGKMLRSIDLLQLGKRTWTVVATALPSFEQKIRSDRPGLVLRVGIGLSLMVTLLIWLFLDDRARALQTADQAQRLALYDPLTGLPNRKLLDERLTLALAQAKRRNGRLALLFIDLDKFKPINDNFGHAYGDLLLKEVAKRLHDHMRESDTASRLGGDEFVALLLDVDRPEAVMTAASKILHELTEPYHIVGHVFEISASIGAALYPEHGADGLSLMKSADLAMYEAKNSGRGNVKLART